MKTIVFGGGCFWCTEAIFQMLKGVEKVESGYAGGSTGSTSSPQAGSPQAAPTYEQVSSGMTGHAEVIRVTYDPAVISYEDLLTVFFGSHDPTTPNRQGADVGEQYRSVILYESAEDKATAERVAKDIQDSLTDDSHVVTQIVPLGSPPAGGFFKAEDYHQNYFKANTSAPYCQLIIEPKIEKVKKRFAELVKQ